MDKKDELEIIEKWVVKNINSSVVPGDEGNSEGLVYNMLSLLHGWGDEFNYRSSQCYKLKEIFEKHGEHWYEDEEDDCARWDELFSYKEE